MSTAIAVRLLDTVLCVPVGGNVTTEIVHREIAERGHAVSRRTVERDLVTLSARFGLSKSKGWWTRSRKIE